MTRSNIEELLKSESLDNKIHVVAEETFAKMIGTYIKVLAPVCTLLLALLCFMLGSALRKLDRVSQKVDTLSNISFTQKGGSLASLPSKAEIAHTP